MVSWCHPGVWRAKQNTISAQQLVHLLLEALLLLKDEGWRVSWVGHLTDGQT